MAKQEEKNAKIIISIFVLLAAITFLLAAMTHLQLTLALGLAEPKIIPASIVEGLCALFFIISAVSIFSNSSKAWKRTFFAHAFAIAGIILGQISLAVGAGPRTESNDLYHSISLLLIIADSFYLMTATGRAVLKKKI